MNAKNPCMNCSIAATPHPILLESPMPREVFPCPTIAPRRIHAKLILRIEPGGNKADSPHACLQSASDDRNGGKLPSGSVKCSTICGKPMARNVVLPRQERSSQTGNHGTTPPYGRELPPGRTRKGEDDSDSLFRVFRWIPWLISDPCSSGDTIPNCLVASPPRSHQVRERSEKRGARRSRAGGSRPRPGTCHSSPGGRPDANSAVLDRRAVPLS